VLSVQNLHNEKQRMKETVWHTILVDGDAEGGWDDMAMAILSLNLFLKWDNAGACLLKHVTSSATTEKNQQIYNVGFDLSNKR